MRLAFSTNAFTRVSLEEAITAIARLGYDGVEVMADVPHAFPPDLTRAEIARLRALLALRGVAVSNVNAFMLYGIRDCYHPSFIDPDPADRRARLEHSRNAIRLARDLGAPSVSIEPGGPLPAGVGRDTAEGWFLEAVESLGALGERLHVDVLIEPEPGLLIETSRQFLDLIAKVRSPRVALNFDVGHFYAAGEDPVALVPLLAPHARHYHLEDIAASREHRHLVPGRGAIPIREVLGAIRRTGHSGFVTIELYPYADDPEGAAREALAHVREVEAVAAVAATRA